jgi:hypothetical protein
MAAKETTMETLHEQLAKSLLDMLTKGVQEVQGDKIVYRKAKAADLNVIRQFLKDNDISADANHNSTLQELETQLPFDNENVVNFRR